jgi:hypothetical protein
MTYTTRKPARKPLSPAQQLEAAIKRVQKGLEEGKDYRVCAHGKRLDTGETFYCVPSDSEKLRGLWHVVTVTKTGLDCDCFFSREKHQVCTHRATVYLFLQAKAAAEKAAKKQESAPAPAPTIERTRDNALPARYDDQEAASPVAGYPSYLFKPENHNGDYCPRDYYQHAYR